MLVAVAALVVVATGIRGAAGIVAPTMLSLVLTIAVLPIGAVARRHGWPGWLATLTALASAYAIVLGLLVGTVVCLIKLIDLLPQFASNVDDLTKKFDTWMSSNGLSNPSTSAVLKKLDPDTIGDALSGPLSSIIGAATGLFFLVALMFFFVAAVPGFAARVRALRRGSPS